MEHDVFISYSSQNKEAAQAICHILEQNEIRCWIAPRDILPGSEYGDLIDEAIKDAAVVVVLFSETAATSLWVKGELNIAFEEQKIIIPFRLDNTPFTGQNRVILNQKHWIDAYPDYKTKFADLVDAVVQSIGRNRKLVVIHDKKKNLLKKYILGSVFAIIIIVTLLLFFPIVKNYTHVYSYDQNGLHVKVKGLSESQENAITSILDNMVLVEGGTFIMGNTLEMKDYLTEQDSLSKNPHEVTLDNFYINKFEVTQEQWLAFLSTEGRCIKDGDNIPMDMLSWEDAKCFVDSLSSITGLNFALPTEAQWEYAARGGKNSKGYIFSGNNDPTEVGWTSFDNLSSAHEIGGKRYNELGLYDMTGNVAEWCLDYFAPYSVGKKVNPQGPNRGIDRVLRGGDFRIDNFFDMKITTRYFDSPFVNRRGVGLRLVINVK